MEPGTLQKIYARQTDWFRSERNRLLRRAGLPGKQAILDLGAGPGVVLSELNTRANGLVVGLDRDIDILKRTDLTVVAGNAVDIPFHDHSFDLVLAQMFFLWATPLDAILGEISRVLEPGGHLIVVAEPDYGAAMEYPDHNRIKVLMESLHDEGADLCVGRKLGGRIAAAGFDVDIGTHNIKPGKAAEPDSVFAAPELMASDPATEFLFIPYFWFFAQRRE